MRYSDGGLLPPVSQGRSSLTKYNPQLARKRSQKFVRIFAWCYLLGIVLSYIIGWVVGDLIK